VEKKLRGLYWLVVAAFLQGIEREMLRANFDPPQPLLNPLRAEKLGQRGAYFDRIDTLSGRTYA
jgi:hypothetical protein